MTVRASHFRSLAIVLSALTAVSAVLPALAATPRRAQPQVQVQSPVRAVELNREVLGLYDGASEPRADQSRLHRLLEMPLNHLGYKLTLRDISKELPDARELARYRAVATWFSGRVSNAPAYLAWAAGAARAGMRFVVVDSAGALGGKEDIADVNAFLGALGLEYALYYVGDTKETRIDVADPAVVGFEHALDASALPGHQVVLARAPQVTAHLAVTDPAHRWVKAPASTLVATGPGGGFIASGFAIHYDKQQNRVRWIVNPFEFLRRALGDERRPIPDTTTHSGRRIYFSHIDGDGWNNLSEVPLPSDQRPLSAEVMLERLIAPYPDLPVSVGLIAGDIDPAQGGRPDAATVAAKMFALSQVEVASHTHTHPYHWQFYEAYRREAELARVARYVERNPNRNDKAYVSLAELARRWRATQTGSPDTQAEDPTPQIALPRALARQPFDLAGEVKGALDVSTRLAPLGKTARLYLWSGDTRPFEAAVRATRLAGARNLNGGDSRLDSLYPSVAYVPPLSRTVGAERQIYAVNSNENTYTNGWSGPFDAFKTLSETLDNTELPRRLKGFNLYYHSYSASRADSLAAVTGHLDRARSAPLAPITASRYAGIAEGFFATRILAEGAGRWRILDRGELQTVRFEPAAGIDIDIGASKGVIGTNRHSDALYVTLDPAAAAPLIVEHRPTPIAARSQRRPTTTPARPPLSLVESRWSLEAVSAAPCAVRGKAQGYGAGEMVWEDARPGDFNVIATRGAKQLASLTATAGVDGRLAFRIEADAIEPLEIAIACTGEASASLGESSAAPATKKRPKRARSMLRRTAEKNP